MPLPSDEFDAAGSVTIHLDFDVGRTSVRMGKYELTGGDAMAQAAVVDRVIKQILAGWPRTAYASEIRRLVRVALCEGART
jgi:hypothetical protein